MAIAQSLIPELQHESIVTRKMLERIPFDKADWKPHEKSMSLIKLAQHIVDLPGWVYFTVEQDELDFAKFTYAPPTPNNTTELIDLFDKNLKSAEESLQKCSDEEMMKPWTLRNGERVFFTLPKVAVVRSFSFNHLIHHRGQLSVYLRLLNIPVPGAYGPSADEQQ